MGIVKVRPPVLVGRRGRRIMCTGVNTSRRPEKFGLPVLQRAVPEVCRYKYWPKEISSSRSRSCSSLYAKRSAAATLETCAFVEICFRSHDRMEPAHDR